MRHGSSAGCVLTMDGNIRPLRGLGKTRKHNSLPFIFTAPVPCERVYVFPALSFKAKEINASGAFTKAELNSYYCSTHGFRVGHGEL